MRMTIKHYIWNCYVYRRSKASKDQINELLKLLFISEQRWQDIIEFHYQFIKKWWKQRDSDSNRSII